MGDPGAYDAYSANDLAQSAQKSYAKSMQAGTGGFGSSAPARAPLSVAGESPGPGAYDASKPQRPEAKQSSAFASKTTRGAYTKTSDAPGVGSYDPVVRTDTVLGGDSAFKNAEQRFKKDTQAQAQAHVGPGSYHYENNTITASLSQMAVSKSGVGFSSTAKRPELASVVDTPGPGAYNESAKQTDSRPSSAFKSSTKRDKAAELSYMGDPGAYDAYSANDLAQSAQKSYAKSMQAGTGGFGSSAPARAPLSVAGESPGPGAYDASKPQRPEAKQSSAFASKTTRGAYTKTSDAPGVGSYDPVVRTDTVLGGDSAFKNAEQRFKKDTQAQAQAHVGPGSYHNEVNTINARLAPDTGKVSSAFASTTLRDGFLGV